MRELLEDASRRRARDRETHPLVGEIAQRHAGARQVLTEPPLVPILQVVGAREPEAIGLEPRHREVAHQPPGLVQHRCEPDPARGRDRARQQVVQPGVRVGPRDLVARVLRDLIGARRRANRLDLFPDDRLGVRSAQRVVLHEVRRWREVQRHLQPPVHGALRARREELVVDRRRLERPPGRQLLVGVGHHEAPRVELLRRVAEVPVVGRVGPEARHVHPEHVVTGVAVDDPVGDRESDPRALGEPGHTATRGPVVADARHRSDERVPVGGEGERAVHPFLDPGVCQHGEAREPDRKLRHDPVEFLGEQRASEVPFGALDLPVTRVLLVDAEQHAVALALQVREPLEVGDRDHLAGDRRDLGDLVGDQIVMRHRHQRVIDTDHGADPPGPQPRRVHDVLGRDVSLLGLHPPLAVGQRRERQDAVVLDHLGAASRGRRSRRRAWRRSDRACPPAGHRARRARRSDR